MNIYIPPELEGQQAEIKRFVDAMIYKLAKNSAKGKWESIRLSEARKRLSDEIVELDEAIANGNVVEILLECSDCANFALILSDVAARDAGG